MRSVLVGICVVASFAITSVARATTYFVDPTGSNTGACTSPGADACQTIAGALLKTRAAPDPDTIDIAAGTYDERATLDQANDDGLSIVGAGSGMTTIRHQSGAGNFTGFDIGSPTASPAVQLSDLSIEQDAINAEGLDIWTTTAGLSNVAITMGNAANANPAIDLTTGDLTLDHVSVSGAWTGGGLSAAASAGTLGVHVNDSTIATGGGNALSVSAVGSATGSLDVKRSVLSLPAASGSRVIGTTNADTTVDSSLLTGGNAGVLAGATGSDHTTTLRNVTIDAGSPGTSDLGDSGVWADSASAGDLMAITMDSSITVEPQKVSVGSGGSVSCTNSDVPDQTETGIACASGSGGNASSATSALFVNAASGDYHLKTSPLSPAIDTGSSAALAAGESTTDLDGNPRVADGNFDCTARRDRGAYELPPPTASITGPDQAPFGSPVALMGQISLTQPPDPLTYAWTFSDGGSASSQNVSHAFAAPGAQQAALKVMDPHGCSLTATHDITILAPPPTGPSPVTTPGGHTIAFKLGRIGKQKLGRFVTVRVTCPSDACTVSVAGSLNVPGAAKRFKLKKASRSLRAGASATLKLAIPKKVQKAALHALRRHKKVTARLSLKVTSGTAKPATASRTVTLRR
jgi:hypothetical protein